MAGLVSGHPRVHFQVKGVDARHKAGHDRLSGGLPEHLDDALRVFVRATIDNHRDNPRLHQVLFEEAPRAPAFLSRLHALEETLVDATAALLDEHPAVHANGRLSARLVVATIESLVHRLIASPDPTGVGPELPEAVERPALADAVVLRSEHRHTLHCRGGARITSEWSRRNE